jgi:hypothetical protein
MRSEQRLSEEDIAYKMHSMISPVMARCWLLPTWGRWAEAII